MANTYNITIQQGQTLLDIALQEYGSVDGVIMLMRDNGLELDAELTPGTSLVVRNTPINLAVKNYYAAKGMKLASAVVDINSEPVDPIKGLLAYDYATGQLMRSGDGGLTYSPEMQEFYDSATDGGVNYLLMAGYDLCFVTNFNVFVNYSQGFKVNVDTQLGGFSATNAHYYQGLIILEGEWAGAVSTDNGQTWIMISGDLYQTACGVRDMMFGNHIVQHVYQDGDSYLMTTSPIGCNCISACDAGNGYVYIGSSDGHVWRNETQHDYTTYIDLGLVLDDVNNYGKECLSIIYNNGRIIVSIQDNIYSSDDDFATKRRYNLNQNVVYKLVALNKTIIIGAAYTSGCVRSTDNAASFTTYSSPQLFTLNYTS